MGTKFGKSQSTISNTVTSKVSKKAIGATSAEKNREKLQRRQIVQKIKNQLTSVFSSQRESRLRNSAEASKHTISHGFVKSATSEDNHP